MARDDDSHDYTEQGDYVVNPENHPLYGTAQPDVRIDIYQEDGTHSVNVFNWAVGIQIFEAMREKLRSGYYQQVSREYFDESPITTIVRSNVVEECS